jgi:hypothetical protein
VTLLAVATVTIAAAALGALYARAASESTLRDRLVAAPVSDTGIVITDTVDAAQDGATADVTADPPRPGDLFGYPTRIASLQAEVRITVAGSHTPALSYVVYRDGVCAHVVVVAGRCPTEPGDAMAAARTLSGDYGWKLGSVLDVNGLTVDVAGGPEGSTQEPLALRVVGVYRPADVNERYWFDHPYFRPRPGSQDKPDWVDSVFVDQDMFPSLSRPTNVPLSLDYPLDATRVRLAEEPALRADVAAVRARYPHGGPVDVLTSLPQVLDAADHERTLLQLSTALVAVQLALLAWLVLFQVVTDAAESRGNEVALAKLRGFRARSTVAFGLGQPVAVLVAALPLGLLAAWAAVALMSRWVLVPGTPVQMTWGAVAGALLGFTGAVVGAALAARRVLTRPVLEQWRRVPDVQPGAASLIVDLVLVVAAVAGLVALRASGSAGTAPRPVSLLGPGLLVLAIALLGVRLLPYFGRAALGPTRASPRVGSFLAVRQVLRRPAGLRLAALLAVAVGLATFAIDGEAVADGNRQVRAGVEVGAPVVLAAQYDPAHNPVTITHAVDPQGRWAMAAATWLNNQAAVEGNVLGVDTTRLAAVAHWPGGSAISASDAATQLGPPVPGPVTFKGTAIRVHITQISRGPGPPPNVTVEVRPGVRQEVQQRMGPLRPGTATYTARVPCGAGCTLTRLVWDRPIDFQTEMRGSVQVTAFEVRTPAGWKPFDAGLAAAAAWRGAGDGGESKDTLTSSAQGLRDDYSSTFGASPAIGHVDSPSPLPLIATPSAVRTDAAAVAVLEDTSGRDAAFTQTGTVSLLPVVLDYGVLVDVRYVNAQLPQFANEAGWQVWLGPRAPADGVQRLKAAGLLVQSVRTQGQRADELGRQGPALALLLLVACAIAGAALAAGATALAVAVTGRRRAFELAALSAVGVGRRSLLRSCVGEQLILLGTGFALGLPAGVLAARLALPAIPEYSDATPVPLDYAPHAAVIVAFAVAVGVLLVVTAWVAGTVLMRSAVPTRLREAAQ